MSEWPTECQSVIEKLYAKNNDIDNGLDVPSFQVYTYTNCIASDVKLNNILLPDLGQLDRGNIAIIVVVIDLMCMFGFLFFLWFI